MQNKFEQPQPIEVQINNEKADKQNVHPRISIMGKSSKRGVDTRIKVSLVSRQEQEAHGDLQDRVQGTSQSPQHYTTTSERRRRSRRDNANAESRSKDDLENTAEYEEHYEERLKRNIEESRQKQM